MKMEIKQASVTLLDIISTPDNGQCPGNILNIMIPDHYYKLSE